MFNLGTNPSQGSESCGRITDDCARLDPVDDKVGVSMLPCLTATLKTVSPANLRGGEQITLQGQDFPSTKECTDVYVGSQQCTTVSSGRSRVRCIVNLGEDTDDPLSTNK